MAYSQIIPSERTYTVTYDSGTTSFVFSSTPDLKYGQTYKFIINSDADVRFIFSSASTDPLTNYISDGIYYTPEAVENTFGDTVNAETYGIDSGTIILTVGHDVVSPIYYGDPENWTNTNDSLALSYEQLVIDRGNTFEEWRVKTNVLSDKFGDFSSIDSGYTTDNVISILNEIKVSIGDINTLDTTQGGLITANAEDIADNTDLIGQEINTVTSLIDTLSTNLGNLSNRVDDDFQPKGADMYLSDLYIDKDNSASSYNGTQIRLTEGSGGSLNIISATTGSTTEIASITSGSNKIFSIDGSGDAIFAGDITGFGSPSDINMKENIEPIRDALDKVCQINGYTFDFKEEFIKNDKQKNRQVGVIAQELEKVLPELVHEAPDGYKRVDYDRIVALLIEAVKELNDKIK